MVYFPETNSIVTTQNIIFDESNFPTCAAAIPVPCALGLEPIPFPSTSGSAPIAAEPEDEEEVEFPEPLPDSPSDMPNLPLPFLAELQSYLDIEVSIPHFPMGVSPMTSSWRNVVICPLLRSSPPFPLSLFSPF